MVIRQNAYNLKREIDNGERVIVGVNKFKDVHDVATKVEYNGRRNREMPS